MPETPEWLTPEESRAWLAWIRVGLRMRYEMNRQLQADHDLSLADFDVLTALSVHAEPPPLSALARQIGWERSRLSHHLRRMEQRDLVTREAATHDARVTVVAMTGAGRDRLTRSAPDHVALVRRLFFARLPSERLDAFADDLEQVLESLEGTDPE